MIFEMTYQVRVSDIDEGLKWYKFLLKKDPNFIPHDGFAEWELIPGCWLQVAEGTPAQESGPLRLGVKSIEAERSRLIAELQIESFEIFAREEVPVKWATFSDPWGNTIGFFEYIEEQVMNEKLKVVIGKNG
ncbi:VOC family protein [Mesobacillus subterraneus]|uniref:VOC family protein n=1 Tax=Mesobacillus subterraneus TaxID=285983 RepID=UPI001CFD9765|nr:VOC family protein [Mesobacillus subterraneus]WLR57482.1 VOC family protein [Mesobacillus subterraneus]